MRDGNGGLIRPPSTSDRQQLTTLQRQLIAGVAVGAAAIAVIGFAGSYAAVVDLARVKGFGRFATLFPIGVDAGILVLLALDLLLTWLRMPLPLLRHIAWLLTVATIAFNAAVAWPDPIGVGMHAVIPVLFVAVVEAARHAIGTAADVAAGRHMEPVRVSRWLLSPIRTFLLWRRMKLWELRSYDEVIALEQQRIAERMRLRAKYGRRWRRRAPVETVIAYRLTRYGRPLGTEGAPVVEGGPVAEDAPAALVEQPVLVSAPQGAPELPAPVSGVSVEGAPERPTPVVEGAPRKSAPAVEGAPQGDAPAIEGAPADVRPAPQPAPERDALNGQGATEGDAPTVEDAPRRAEPEPAPAAEGAKQPADGTRPPTRAEAKRKVRELYDTLGARPKEGQIVALLKSLDGYPYTSRRHAQKLRDEIERDEPKLLERVTDNVRALTG